MRHLAFYFAVAFVALACGPAAMSSASRGYRVQSMQVVAYRLDYVSPAAEHEEQASTAKLLMLDSTQRSTPSETWGRVQLHLNGATIDTGNPKWFTVIFVKDGDELGRQNGPDSIPRPVVSSRHSTSWLNTAYFSIPRGGLPPLTVFVVDRLREVRYEYQILPTGSPAQAHTGPEAAGRDGGAMTDEDCRASKECTLAGRCKALDGKCVAR